MTEKINPDTFIINIYTFEHYVKFSFWVSVDFKSKVEVTPTSDTKFCVNFTLIIFTAQKLHTIIEYYYYYYYYYFYYYYYYHGAMLSLVFFAWHVSYILILVVS